MTDSAIGSDLGTLVSFNGVDKTFDNGTTALEDISFDISSGDFVSVVGPSGCGKSTLLRLVSGLSAPSRGEVVVPDTLPGFVFQEANLLPWRNVLANVSLLDQLDDVPRNERRARAERALATVGLTGFEKSMPAQLSGGMRMRVSIARALVSEPSLLLMDEPFGALDEITRLRQQEELQQIIATGRYTGLFITHSVSEAVYLSNRVLVMSPRPGRIVGEIRVDIPYPRPADMRLTSGFQHLVGEVSRAMSEAHR